MDSLLDNEKQKQFWHRRTSQRKIFFKHTLSKVKENQKSKVEVEMLYQFLIN